MAGVFVALALAAFGVQHRFETVVPDGSTPPAVPTDVAADADGFVYVLHRPFVQKYSPDGALIATWGGWGAADGQFAEPDVYRQSPSALDVDGLGHVDVADSAGDRIVKFTTEGEFVANRGGLENPVVLRSDREGNVLVAGVPDSAIFPPPRPLLHKLAPDGAILAARMIPYPTALALAPGGRVYRPESPEAIAWMDPKDLQDPAPYRSGAFELAFGARPNRGIESPSCCGIAFLDGLLWVARSPIKTLEAYGPEGGLVAACPLESAVQNVAAGRDGRLYVLAGTSVLRYGETAEPCDTTPPAVTSMRVTRVLRVSSYRRLRKATLSFRTSEQGTAELTFRRLVRRRRPVLEARFDGIRARVDSGGGVRFANLLWRDRLPAGRYEIGVVVTDRAGLRSEPAIQRVRVTR